MCVFAYFLSIGNTVAKDCAISDAFELGKVEEKDIDEASGLIASRTQKGLLWTHNDHGDDARIFAMSEEGEDFGTWDLEDVDHKDFEDITQGPGPIQGINYIYLGDIGNNDYDREEVYVYRFPEPEVSFTKNAKNVIDKDNIEKITIINPHGPGEDMETLMMDPITNQLYVLTKNHEEAIAYIYKFSPPMQRIQSSEKVTIEMEEVGYIEREMLVAGDVSIDGSKILLRRAHSKGAWMWERQAEQSVEEALINNVSCDLKLVEEEQGEAIAVDPSAEGFYTTSEGEHQPIYYYEFN